MSPDKFPPGTWRERLAKRMDERWVAQMAVWDAYYEGDHQLNFATWKFREAFGSLFATVADNWMRIVVDASAERLVVQGFRFGDSRNADQPAWDIWQANNLDGAADMVHTDSIKLSEAYWLVEPVSNGSSDPPRITAEHPSQMIVATAPGDRRKRLAALKKWMGEDGFAYCTLYLPDQVWKYESAGKMSAGGMTGGRINWVARSGDPGGPNPLGEVPVIPIANAPSMLHGGTSDIAAVMDLQNAINKLLADMLIGSEYQSFPQRVLLGVEIPKDPDTGQPIRASELQSSQSRLWAFANENAKVAEFNAADLKNYTDASQHIVNHLSAQTRTPPHYLLGQIVNASGDALKAAETGLVKKVTRKMAPFGEGHEEMMRLALKASGDEAKAAQTNAETIWRDPETRSQSELADSLLKLANIGVPQEVLWEKYGFSPQEIDRMRQIQETESLLQAIPADRQALRITETAAPPGGPAPQQTGGAQPTPQAPPAAPAVKSGA